LPMIRFLPISQLALECGHRYLVRHLANFLSHSHSCKAHSDEVMYPEVKEE